MGCSCAGNEREKPQRRKDAKILNRKDAETQRKIIKSLSDIEDKKLYVFASSRLCGSSSLRLCAFAV
jgi:fructose-1,6-bisphosphatase/inositol monophosphatase family enzyme